ncbi:unnamed protein product [Phyllotreta striolata]|uniref:Enoyl-[acyl-carrier-protein] reductase, mitochondrial n=1 Tax=Phyllotreta striolata TaxID=444603 RepID=A0A9N9XT41_PHYSR|nr:unnamed protein product [Phyllotreta striolata]
MDQGENKLDVDMSHLEISETEVAVEDEAQNTATLRRSGRRKSATEEPPEKKRVLQKPKKLSTNKEHKQIVNYYLDRKIKRTSSCLETIFEMPKGDTYMTMPLKLTYTKTGHPSDVLRIEEYPMPQPEASEVLVEMLAAAVNPVDINIIQGKYPIQFPGIGFEGVGRVSKVGPSVTKFRIGEHVVPTTYAGTWRTHLVLDEANLISLPKEIGVAEAATFFVNPITMYRMLKDYAPLEPGDTVIQNGANSSCGLIAIQLCKAWGLNTVNVVRDRPDVGQLKEYLIRSGATYVFTDKEIAGTDVFKSGKLPKPKLGLNCIGGESANSILRHIDHGGVLVTYGGMSLEPIRVSTSTLVFKTVRLDGFNLFKWFSESGDEDEKARMFGELIDLMVKGAVRAPPHVLVDFNRFSEAVEMTLTKNGMVGKKYILDLRAVTSKM